MVHHNMRKRVRTGPILFLYLKTLLPLVVLIIFAMQYPQLCSNTPTAYMYTYMYIHILFSYSHGISRMLLFVQIMHYNANNRKWDLISEYPCFVYKQL